MINSFKNFERLRYRISNDIKSLVVDSKKSNVNMKEEISNTIFATVFSAFITEVAFNNSTDTVKLWAIIKMIVIFIVIYICSYWIYNLLHCKLLNFIEKRKVHTVDKGMSAMIQIQKDFDNIACDSILVARDFKVAFENLKNIEENSDIRKDENLKEFYLFEIMHYLGTACEKTKDLVANKQKCIRTMDEAEGVDIFRVNNIVNIMQELDKFLDSNLVILDDCAGQKTAIEYQHNLIKGLIKNIKENM